MQRNTGCLAFYCLSCTSTRLAPSGLPQSLVSLHRFSTVRTLIFEDFSHVRDSFSGKTSLSPHFSLEGDNINLVNDDVNQLHG